MDFIDTLARGQRSGHILAELEISEGSALAGCPVGQVIQGSSRVTVLGVRKPDGTIRASPQGDDILELGDLVIIIGDEEEVRLLGRKRQKTVERPAP